MLTCRLVVKLILYTVKEKSVFKPTNKTSSNIFLHIRQNFKVGLGQNHGTKPFLLYPKVRNILPVFWNMMVVNVVKQDSDNCCKVLDWAVDDQNYKQLTLKKNHVNHPL